MKAQKALSSISANRDLWIAQYRQEIFEHDMISSLAGAREEGIKQGIQQGLAEGRAEGLEEGTRRGKAEGRAEGRAEQALATARMLKQAGIDAELIAKSTGLSLEEIAAL